MTEEYELSTYDRHKLNYNKISLGRLPTQPNSLVRIGLLGSIFIFYF